MAGGLLALLDDIAALVKVTASTMEGLPAQVAKTSAKVTGVVVDDTAVTPKYVVGLSPKRELPIIVNIARRSLVNKLLILTPGALLLGYVAPWAITPILMFGGCYLCLEGYEKVHGMFHHARDDDHDGMPDEVTDITPEQLEKERTDGAVRTDIILSAEIIAIAYGTVADKPFLYQAIVLVMVAVGITIGVYGFVGLLVKMDDIGLHLARASRFRVVRHLGRALVKGMVPFLKVLGLVGTIAMLWVGAEIISHGVPPVHHGLEHLHETLGGGALALAVKITVCALGGLVIGAVVAQAVSIIKPALKRQKR